MAVFDLSRERHWSCPNCVYTRVTFKAGKQAVVHRCRGLGGLIAPLVEDGIRCRVTAREREDYIGAERVQTDASGRPIMAVVTTRDDGEDCVVLAPTAVARGGAS